MYFVFFAEYNQKIDRFTYTLGVGGMRTWYQQGDLSQEKIEEISAVISNLEKGDSVEIKYFVDGYYKTVKGKIKIDIIEQKIFINNIVINFTDIFDLIKL